MMSTDHSAVAVSRLVNRHLSALVSEARQSGIPLDDLTIELAAHASCAALNYWSAAELRGLLDAAAAEADPCATDGLDMLTPLGSA